MERFRPELRWRWSVLRLRSPTPLLPPLPLNSTQLNPTLPTPPRPSHHPMAWPWTAIGQMSNRMRNTVESAAGRRSPSLTPTGSDGANGRTPTGRRRWWCDPHWPGLSGVLCEFWRLNSHWYNPRWPGLSGVLCEFWTLNSHWYNPRRPGLSGLCYEFWRLNSHSDITPVDRVYLVCCVNSERWIHTLV